MKSAQDELQKVNDKINEKKAQETTKGYSVGGEFADAFMKNGSFAKGVLADKGEFIEEVCNKYNVDPYLIASIMANETGWGTSNAIKNANNPGGIMDPSSNWMSIKHFDTLEAGIEAMVKNIADGYINKGLTTVQSIGNKYCPVGAANDPTGLNSGWIPGVVSIYNQLSGKHINASTDISL